MSSIKLSPRLRALADWVPCGARLADIGSDHAYIPLALLQEGRIQSAVAGDILPDTMRRAQAHALALGFSEERCSCRAGDGLAVLQAQETDCLLIAGMGAELMIRILEKDLERLQDFGCFILSPHSKPWLLREWMHRQGFALREEQVLQDRKRFYEIHRYEAGAQSLDAYKLYFGPELLKQGQDTLVRAYFDWRKGTDKTIIAARLDSSPAESLVYREALERKAFWQRKEEEDDQS